MYDDTLHTISVLWEALMRVHDLAMLQSLPFGLQMSGRASNSDAVSTSSISLQPAYGLQPPVPFQQPGPPQPLPDQAVPDGDDTTFTHNPVYR